MDTNRQRGCNASGNTFRHDYGAGGTTQTPTGVATVSHPQWSTAAKELVTKPGGGIRICGGEFHFSAKAMIALMSDKQISTFSGCPILEIQRRLPLSAPTHGDTRVMISFMYPLCKHCGFN